MASTTSENGAVGAVRRSRPALLPLVVGIALALSACGSDDEGATTTSGDQEQQAPDTPEGQPRPGGSRFPGGVGGLPGASGLVAAIDATTMQVQGGGAQVAVTYTDATEITATVAGSATDVAVGACVFVQTDASGGEQASEVNATSVAVTEPAEDGSCQAGFGGGAGFGGQGGPPGGMPTDRPEGAPSDLPSDYPSDGPRSGGRFGGGVSGVVTGVNDGSFIVEATTFDLPEGDEASPEPTTSTVTVVTSESTTWSVEVVTGPEALVEGVCVTAIGEADDTGAVTAESIAVQPAEDSECPAMRGGGGGA
jgi:hypothetical protein